MGAVQLPGNGCLAALTGTKNRSHWKDAKHLSDSQDVFAAVNHGSSSDICDHMELSLKCQMLTMIFQ
jgi:hypothetical protein